MSSRLRLCKGMALVTVGLLTASCSCRQHADPPDATASGPPRVLMVAVDGLEWKVVLPLIRDGRMPNLEGLMKRGVFGKLETFAPAKSPVIWTTVATGKLPQEHGIRDFLRPTAGGQPEFYNSRDRLTKAFWNILSDAGKQVTVIGWWNTFPVEPITGTLVAQTNTWEGFEKNNNLAKAGLLRGVPGQVYPESRQDEMLSIFAEVEKTLPGISKAAFGDMGTIVYRPNRLNWERCYWAIRADESYRRIATRLLKEKPQADCAAVYFGLPDIVGHRFWRFHEPDAFKFPPKPRPLEKFGSVVRDAYALFDRALGDLIAATPKGTVIFVLSDHGMHAENTQMRFDSGEGGLLRDGLSLESGAHKDGPPGVLIVAGPQVQPPTQRVDPRTLKDEQIPVIGSVLDITPTLLRLLDVAIGRDMSGDILVDVLSAEFQSQTEPRYVPTHDTAEWFATRGEDARNAPGSAERYRQLRALGYIDDSEEIDSTSTRPTSQNAGG